MKATLPERSAFIPYHWNPKTETRTYLKNVRWMTAHHNEIDTFEVWAFYAACQAQVGLTADEYGRSQCAAVLIAYLRDGTQVVNIWSDRGDLFSWLKRPVFLGIPLRWFGKSGYVTLNPVNDRCH
jgi:hypothetical protein